MNKKALVLILLLILCVVCAGCIGVVYFGYSSMSSTITASTTEIKTTNLDHICRTGANIVEDDGVYFTKSFTEAHDYDQTVAILGQVFPTGFDCDNLLPNGGNDYWGMLTRGQSVAIDNSGSQKHAVLTFKSKDGTKTNTIEFVKIGNTWHIMTMEQK